MINLDTNEYLGTIAEAHHLLNGTIWALWLLYTLRFPWLVDMCVQQIDSPAVC